MPHISKCLPESERADFEMSLQGYPPRCVRLKSVALLDELPFETTATPWNSVGRLLTDQSVRPSQFLQYAVGDYYIQDAGSLLATALADVQPDELVCDLCAAPGGKSSAVLERLSGKGFLVANEVISSRVAVLQHNLGRIGNPRFLVFNEDPSQLVERLPESFDVVLVDAPCSGQTLTAKNKRGENAFDSKHIAHAAARQHRILRSAFALLKVGGRLIYSTCTFADEENEHQIESLLTDYADAIEIMPHSSLKAWESPILTGCYRVWPHRDPTAGAFAARLRKTQSVIEEASTLSKKQTRKRLDQNSTKSKGVDLAQVMISEFGEPQGLQVIADQKRVFGFDAASFSSIESNLLNNLVPLSSLPEILSVVGKNVVPHQNLAMFSADYPIDGPTLDLSDDLAKQLINGAALHHNALEKSHQDSKKFAIARWNLKPLGWVKWAGNRWNNLIPNVARIAMNES